MQIIHDLKNQLNGLKLYATFLRTRMEKSQRPADELETIMKLIAGLERAATDMNALVRYGRPLELRPRAGIDLFRVLEGSFDGSTIKREAGAAQLTGAFDPDALAEAFKTLADNIRRPTQIVLRREGAGAGVAICEINAALENDADPFTSFTGSAGMRMAMAAKIIRAHGGAAARTGDAQLQIRLPLDAAAG